MRVAEFHVLPVAYRTLCPNGKKHEAAQPGEVPINTGKSVWSTSQVISQLSSSASWSGNTITYAIPSSSFFFPYGEIVGFSPLNAVQRAATIEAMELWDDLIAPSIVQTSSAKQCRYQGFKHDHQHQLCTRLLPWRVVRSWRGMAQPKLHFFT